MTWTKAEEGKINELSLGIKSLDRAMRGSNGEIGLLAKVDNMDTRLVQHMQSELNCPIHDAMIILQGNPKQGINAKGLIDEVADHTKFIGTVRKWTYAMIATTSSAVILLVIELFRGVLAK
jgi:hypothetical protein